MYPSRTWISYFLQSQSSSANAFNYINNSQSYKAPYLLFLTKKLQKQARDEANTNKGRYSLTLQA